MALQHSTIQARYSACPPARLYHSANGGGRPKASRGSRGWSSAAKRLPISRLFKDSFAKEENDADPIGMEEDPSESFVREDSELME
jgi:hypothetical protein